MFLKCLCFLSRTGGGGFLADSHSVLNLDDSVAVAQEFIGLY